MPKPELRLVVNLESLPNHLPELTKLRNWVLWKFAETRGGKVTKVPHQVSGAKASSTDPETWVSFAEAMAARGNGFDGIGFVMDAGLAAFDVDDCRNPETGDIHAWALEKVAKANTYAEVTISGTGIRIIGTADPALEVHRKQQVGDGVSCETYCGRAGRYIVMTGHALNEKGLANVTSEVRATVEELSRKARAESSAKRKEAAEGSVKEATPIPPSVMTLLSLPNQGPGKPHGAYPTRSELTFAFVVGCFRYRVREEDIAAAILDDKYSGNAIFEHVAENRGHDYAWAQIEKARDKSGETARVDSDKRVTKLNERYAYCLASNKDAVMMFEGETFRLLQVNSFVRLLSNEPKIAVSKRKEITVGEHWVQHADRRTYYGIEFAPVDPQKGYYNTWKGFAVQPASGDCSKFLAHVRDNVCHGNEEHYRWVVGWFAHVFQYPAGKIGTSLVLRGKQGVGKTIVGKIVGSLIGKRHYLLVSEPRYITGQFNAHMASTLLLHADEAFWAGDKRSEGKLKDLITGDHHLVEHKGIDPIVMANYARLFVTGNADWLVPAGMRERRFTVLDVADTRMGDHAYFAAIEKEMASGGREALMKHLLEFDLTSTNIRDVLKTEALLEQQVESFSPQESWWYDTLQRGKIPAGADQADTCSSEMTHRRYVRHAQIQGVRRKAIETSLGMFLRKITNNVIRRVRLNVKATGPQGQVSTSQDWCYVLPPLSECREMFARHVHQSSTITWDDQAEWQKDQTQEDGIPF